MQQSDSIVRISNILNLTRQEFSVIEKHIIHVMLKEIKENQGFHWGFTQEWGKLPKLSF